LLADRIVVMNPKNHGIERIIDNTDRRELFRNGKAERINDILVLLDNQFESPVK